MNLYFVIYLSKKNFILLDTNAYLFSTCHTHKTNLCFTNSIKIDGKTVYSNNFQTMYYNSTIIIWFSLVRFGSTGEATGFLKSERTFSLMTKLQEQVMCFLQKQCQSYEKRARHECGKVIKY